MGGWRRRGYAVGAVLAVSLALPALSGPVTAGPNRCGTSVPDRSPTWVDGAGTHWFDQRGLWTQGPHGSMFGSGGVDFEHPGVQVDPWANHSLQVDLGASRHCAVVGNTGAGTANTGEFPVEPPPAVVPMPWLHRDGQLFKSSDGRTTILRGVDYPYNQEIFEAPYNLTDADFSRIASWGMNLLRIRISSARSGFAPNTQAEPGYWEHLDHLIADANRHGIYVLPSTVTGDTEAMSTTSGHDQLKFVRGTPDHDWWVAYEAKLFARYRDWPGVVGFDTLNEDDSYPPYVHDRLFMGTAHTDANAALRRADRRHIYFQEPSGWSYWGAEYWPGMMNGVDIGDANRFFCPKWKAGGASNSDLDKKSELAKQSNAPMFVCEAWIDKGTNDEATVLAQQRAMLAAMDSRLLGGARVLYGPSDGYGALTHDGKESFWVNEFVRPYPLWAGGRITGVKYDFGSRRLDVQVARDGSGATELFVPQPRTYPNGFVVTSSSGAQLTHDGIRAGRARGGVHWDAARQRIILPAGSGPVTITLSPRVRS